MEEQDIEIEEKKNPVMKGLAIGISILFHPLMMPTIVFALVFLFCPGATGVSPANIFSMLKTLFIITFLFPLASTFVFFYILRRNFSVHDLNLENQKDRFFPFIFTGIFYSAITFMFMQKVKDPTIVVLMGGMSLTVLVLALITRFWKISAHAVGVCGAWGFIIIVSYFYPYEEMMYPVGGLALIAGLVLSARLYLNAHTTSQVFGGALFGLLISAISFFVLNEFVLPLIY